MPEIPDAEVTQLLKKSQEGDAEAFGKLYEQYAQKIFCFLFSQLNDRLDAEDLTEDVFWRVWRSLPGYKEHGIPFAAYLFRIARNALIDHYRRSRRSMQNIALEDEMLRDVVPGPGEMAFANIERQEIRFLLEKLREDYRTVLLLRFLSDLSPEETGVVMGKSPGAVRVLQHRALAAFRNILGESRLENGIQSR